MDVYRIVVVSGPSGCGKTTLIKNLLSDMRQLKFSTSHTTRQRRTGEVPGEDYYFTTEKEFRRMIENNEFAEWARVHDNYYGTSWKEIKNKASGGQQLVLDIDVQGAAIIRKKFPRCRMVFIMPPSVSELEKRLLNRENRLNAAMKKRIAKSVSEMKEYKHYDYVLINDVLKNALEELKCIVASQMHLTCLQNRRIEKIIGGL